MLILKEGYDSDMSKSGARNRKMVYMYMQDLGIRQGGGLKLDRQAGIALYRKRPGGWVKAAGGGSGGSSPNRACLSGCRMDKVFHLHRFLGRFLLA